MCTSLHVFEMFVQERVFYDWIVVKNTVADDKDYT